jgi:hypothetical protein
MLIDTEHDQVGALPLLDTRLAPDLVGTSLYASVSHRRLRGQFDQYRPPRGWSRLCVSAQSSGTIMLTFSVPKSWHFASAKLGVVCSMLRLGMCYVYMLGPSLTTQQCCRATHRHPCTCQGRN